MEAREQLLRIGSFLPVYGFGDGVEFRLLRVTASTFTCQATLMAPFLGFWIKDVIKDN